MTRDRIPYLFLLIVFAATPRLAAGVPIAPIIELQPRVLDATAATKAAAPQPMRLGENLDMTPVRTLRKAAEGAVDQIDAVREWNAAHRLPIKVGFERPIPLPLHMRLDAATQAAGSFRRAGDGFVAESPAGGLSWGTHVRVDRAYRLRLHLSGLALPAGSRMWVWGLGEEPVAFGLELRRAGNDLWTPSVGGEDVFFEVEVPGAAIAVMEKGTKSGRAALDIGEVGEVFRIGADGALAPQAGECVVDAACVSASTFGAIDQARKAVAHLEFVLGDGFTYACTGSLLNNTGPTATPYLLTAHHCFSDQTATATLDAFWDFSTAACGGTPPDPSTLGRSSGGTLLATSANSDFTFVRLDSVPAGRTLLGWSTAALANGTTLYRVSHPIPGNAILPQSFSQGAVNVPFEACSDAPRPNFLYSLPTQGGTFGGSSGSPAMLAGGLVVGQLLGGCGPNPEDGCDHRNADVDGAFALTYASVAHYLNPAVSSQPCVPDATTLCIDQAPGDRRFKVKVDYATSQGGGFAGQGIAIPLSSLGITSGGLFSLFSATNPELLVKVLDGCASNQHYWVFYAATTNAGLTTTVTDTVTGIVRTYANADGEAPVPAEDITAFSCS
jgi:hypothetical protein